MTFFWVQVLFNALKKHCKYISVNFMIIIPSSFLAIFSINYSAEQIPAIQVSNKVTPEKLGKILREILL